MLLIDAIYIHESGGKTLLEYLLRELKKAGLSFSLLLDQRLSHGIVDEQANGPVHRIIATEKNRKIFYKDLPEDIDSVFCFANVPAPVTTKKIRQVVLFHNVLILSGLTERNHYPWKQKFLFLAKLLYIRLRSGNVNRWIVQTGTMQEKLADKVSIPANGVEVIPFFEPNENTPMHATQREGFLYVADGVPQKNHTILLDAWEILYHEGSRPVLHLTVPARFVTLCKRIRSMEEKGIRIVNHSVVDKTALAHLYRQCSYLVFPSLAESFGLPLIEAAQAGTGVLAADLSYVSDVIIPSDTFDPHSANDIAAKVAAVQNRELVPARLKIVNQIDQLIALLFKTDL